MNEGRRVSLQTNRPLISGMSFYLFLQLSSLGASCLPSFPARPCKHSGTSWGLESAEAQPAGDLEMGQIKGMRHEGGGGRQRLYLHRGGLQGSVRHPQRGVSGSGKIGR